jgi:hypothetical protein
MPKSSCAMKTYYARSAITCPHVPTEVRWRAEDARDAASRLIKQRQELSDRADALMRAAELAIGALRETMQRMT